MSDFLRWRRLGGPVLAALLGMWILSPLLPLVHQAWDHLRPESDVAAARIQAPSQAPATCHHHPEGCPKDCFCPKTTVSESDAGTHSQHHGSYREPAIAHCTEGSAGQVEPTLLIAFPIHTRGLPIKISSASPLAPASYPMPSSPCLETPWKVPLA